ncbi:MAG: GDP-L-fucose synthase [Deltaproteobacteria bacterium ADurb.BinA179]|jgi:GDP-L-fucose synthase|nr:MAG: GDP-L-fucose synthase [Deltaproteobacteria bacterium ADurb.BinA179]
MAMDRDSKIFIAGHTGLVGAAVQRRLESEGFGNLLVRAHPELDLTRQREVEDFFRQEKPEYVFLCAARVGGILANATYPAEFIYDNIMIAANVIHAGFRFGVKKLLNLGSSCIYPKLAPQPLKEEHLLTGILESTNEPYAIAKIAAIKLCRYYNTQYGTNFLSVMPTNLYGPHDNFDLETSHVLPALIRRFYEAKRSSASQVTLWGTGGPLREFLYVDDLADACVHLMKNYDAKSIGEFINVGTGNDIAIRDLAEMVSRIAGYGGKVLWDSGKPDGTPQKLLDISRILATGWSPSTGLAEGIERTFQWYVEERRRELARHE